ncbi:MAG: hypothetical protein A2Z73_05955 [Deltaproteobacteria bacterium RBG_13_60_28]|nr:MAG: hypothetical protein A2Z73_05955 [Deltaproteobacteria bacterium RBG_13_60_28]
MQGQAAPPQQFQGVLHVKGGRQAEWLPPEEEELPHLIGGQVEGGDGHRVHDPDAQVGGDRGNS